MQKFTFIYQEIIVSKKVHPSNMYSLSLRANFHINCSKHRYAIKVKQQLILYDGHVLHTLMYPSEGNIIFFTVQLQVDQLDSRKTSVEHQGPILPYKKKQNHFSSMFKMTKKEEKQHTVSNFSVLFILWRLFHYRHSLIG